MTPEQKDALKELLKKWALILGKIAGILTSLGVIIGVAVKLSIPYLNAHIDGRIAKDRESLEFEKRVEDIGDGLLDKPRFQLLMLQHREDFEQHLQERFKLEREW